MLVGANTTRVVAQDELLKIREVTADVGYPGRDPNRFTPAILQGDHPLDRNLAGVYNHVEELELVCGFTRPTTFFARIRR